MSPRKLPRTVLCLAMSIAAVAWALTAPAQIAPPTQPGTPPKTAPDGRELTGAELNPVMGSVDGRLIYLSDLGDMARTLPADMRGMSFETLMPGLIERLIDHTVLTMAARRAGLDRRPEIQREMQIAAEGVLESAYVEMLLPAKVTNAAIEARYNLLYANRPPIDQVRARHILVGDEAEAKAIIQELKTGRDFATVARARSKDPDGRTGGELGFFSRDQVWAGFADAAFSLQPGEVSPVPIHNEFGWHIVKVEERRLLAPPTLSEIRDKLRAELLEIAIREMVAEARAKAIVHRFNIDGTEIDPNPHLRSAPAEGR